MLTALQKWWLEPTRDEEGYIRRSSRCDFAKCAVWKVIVDAGWKLHSLGMPKLGKFVRSLSRPFYVFILHK